MLGGLTKIPSRLAPTEVADRGAAPAMTMEKEEERKRKGW